jgi:hypothetical protein
MTKEQLLEYWQEFWEQGQREGWPEEAYTEYHFAQHLIDRADYT